MNNLHPVSRTALVTGSGRNIGRSIAVTIGELGHNVVVNGSADHAACEAVAAEVEQAELLWPWEMSVDENHLIT